MKLIISSLTAVTLLGLCALPALAANNDNSRYQKQDQFIGNYCSRNPRARQCNDWKVNHKRWNRNHYQTFYRYHRHERDFGGNIAAGLFGFGIGIGVGSTIYPGVSTNHVTACENHYRSYDRRTDMFFGYDGRYHRCTL